MTYCKTGFGKACIMKKTIYFSFYVKLTIYLVSSFLLTTEASAQAVKTTIDTTWLKKRIPEMMDSAAVTGLSVAVVQQGKFVWHKGFGRSNNQTRQPVTAATLYEAASLSKVVFSYIVWQLVDQGVLTLDKPLVDYVPLSHIEEVFVKGKVTDARFHKITARMCLGHATGFPNGRYGSLKIGFNPGSNLSYSGEGFTYLQRVVEYLTKKNLEQLAVEYVFGPLQMHHSSYRWQERFTPHMADGHGSQGTVVKHRKQPEARAAYSLVSTAEDLGKFLTAVLNQERLSATIFQEAITPHSKAKSGMLKPLSWGLGVGVFETTEGKGFWHWGDYGTFKAYLVGFPAQQTGLVLLTNSANGLNLGLALSEITVGGDHVPFYVLPFKQYTNPENQIYRAVVDYGVEVALEVYNYYKLKKDRRLTEKTLNNIGTKLLKGGKREDALQMLKMNSLLYPSSYQVYDSLGEVYLALGNKIAAKEYFSKSLSLNPQNWNAARKLRYL